MTAKRWRYSLNLGALVLAACAQATQDDMLDHGLSRGGSAGELGVGGADAAAGTGSTSGSSGSGGSGSGGAAVAGSATGGSGLAQAGSDAGGKSAAGMAGMAGNGLAGTAGAGGPDGGSSGSGGGPSSMSYRYARFVAQSEQAGRVWSSCAELQLQSTGGANIPRTGWTITADSHEADDQSTPGTNAIDGDPATFWHTAWAPAPDDVNDATLPHQLVVDLGSAKVITGFSYLPRQNGANGRIKDWAFYVSNTNGNWGNPVKTGSFPVGTQLQTIAF